MNAHEYKQRQKECDDHAAEIIVIYCCVVITAAWLAMLAQMVKWL